MKDTYTYRGLWWLPDAEDSKLSGTLTINKGEAKLDVDGSFGHAVLSRTETEVELSPLPSPQDRILGLGDGALITLVECHVTQSRVSSPGIGRAIYKARWALVGAHWDADELIGFNQIDIRTSDLETWIGSSPFVYDLGRPETEDPWLTIRVSLPQQEDFPLRNGLTAQIKLGLSTSGVGGLSTEAKLTYSGWIGLRFPELRDLHGVAEAVWTLRNFLCLAVGRPLTLLAVEGFIDALTSAAGAPVPIKIFWGLPQNPDLADRTLFPQQMLFTFEEARGRFPNVLSTWIDHHELLGPVMALYFGTLYHPSLYVEQRFLGYAQALETYDRLRRPAATERDRDEHKSLVAEIVAASPEGEKKWLKGKLAFSNEPVLADRLRYVLGACLPVSERLVGDRDFERFVRAVRDSRNYYTHYTPTLKAKAATGGQLHLLGIQLRTLIEGALLLELGFPCDDVEGLLARAGRFMEIDDIRSQVG